MGTFKSYLAAVRHSQIAQGLGNSCINEMPRLEYIMKGIKRKATNANPCTRLPVTPEILRAIRRVWQDDLDHSKTMMLWTAACMCFFGFLRSGKVVVPSDSGYDPSVHLSFGDVHLDSIIDPQFLEVRIRHPRRIHFGRECMVRLCTVAAMLSYSVHGSDGRPFFRYSRDCAFTRERFVREVRSALQTAGIDLSKYSGHSFCIGAASTVVYEIH